MAAFEGITYYLAQLFSGAKIKAGIGAALLAIEFAIGGYNVAVNALLALMIADFVLGFSVAWKEKNVSFVRLRQGLWKFMTYGLALLIGHNVDIVILHQATEFGFRNAFIVYLAVHESLSSIRHLGLLGAPVPPNVIEKLEVVRKGFE